MNFEKGIQKQKGYVIQEKEEAKRTIIIRQNKNINVNVRGDSMTNSRKIGQHKP